MNTFSGRVAAVTGAGSGIGRALALRLAQRGCHLALSDVDEGSLAVTAETARRFGVEVTEARVDVADRAAVFAWADRAAEEHGRINAIFNNAGVALGATIGGGGYGDFEWLFGVNFWGVVHGTKAFLPHLEASGDGHVVNISSVFALISIPGQGAYNASKAAVRGLTDALRMELEATGVPVSATVVLPGGIRTNVARSARAHESLRDLGIDPKESGRNFEKLFRTEPEKAAETILDAVLEDKRRVLVGPDAHVIDWLARLLPGAYQRVVAKLVQRSMR